MTSASTLDRRTFLLTSGLAGLAAGNKLFNEHALPAPPPPKPQIRTLGRTGIQMPVVSMGVMNADLPQLVARSFELGVRHFDTAEWYQRGRNESMIGKVFKDMGVRDQVVIATKVFVPPPQRTMSDAAFKAFYLKSVEGSLKRLQTDHVDILYLHSVLELKDLHQAGMREALALLKKQGKTRAVGFSTHLSMTQHVEEALKDDFWDVILSTFNFALYQDKALASALKRAADKGIGIVAMKTQSSQAWYLQDWPKELQQLYQGPLLHTAMLKWVLQHPYITTAIPGYTTFDQMTENFSVASRLAYTPEEQRFLTDRRVQLAQVVCRQCGQCVPTCPQRLDVPTLMRAHMYIASYRNLAQGGLTFEEMVPDRNLTACRACPTCRVTCAHGLPTARRLAELKSFCKHPQVQAERA